MKFILKFLFIAISFHLAAQVIPPGQRVDWSHPGYQGSLPDPSIIADVKKFGAVGDGLTNDFNAIQKAISSLNNLPGVVFFPAGTYLLQSSIKLPSGVVLRGESSTLSVLKFNLSSSGYDCISITKNQTLSFVPINGGLSKGSTEISVNDVSSFKVGDYAEIRQQNGPWDIDPKSYATYCVGQVVKIIAISANTLSIEKPLRIDYDPSLTPEISKIVPVQNVGIEFLKIIRDNDPTPSAGGGYNISFKYAANCWVQSVESEKSIGAHILADVSTHLQVTGCYIHDAFTYDGTATRGYGIVMIQHTGECLIENNILRHLRHSMMVKQGANGNVFGYNYSIEPFRSESYSDYGGDISLHGHFAFANLFEGNIIQNIHIDQTGGPAGPYNTFFRNRAELYGIWMTAGSVQSDKQNFVGNEITKPRNCVLNYFGTCYITEGNYEIVGSGHFEYGNHIKNSTENGDIQPVGTSDLNDVTYYKSGFSTLSTDQTSSTIGTPSTLGSGTNSAEERYGTSSVLTYPEPSSSLPVVFSSFHAFIIPQGVLVSWTTEKEINNNFFIVERSKDGIHFSPIDSVSGAGDYLFKKEYQTVDQHPLNGVSFYRIKQVDFDGKSSYSHLVSLHQFIFEKDGKIYPNPVLGNKFRLKLSGFSKGEAVILEILNSQGLVLFNKDFCYQNNEDYEIQLHPTPLKPGIYILLIKTSEKRIVKNFVVE